MARVLSREVPLRLRSAARSSSTSSFLSSSESASSGATLPPRPRNSCNLIDGCRDARRLFQVQAQLIVSNRVRNAFIVSKLLKKVLDFGFSDYALLIFEKIEILGFPDTVCVNTAIKACMSSSRERAERGVVLYFRMKGCGFWPNSYTFPPLIGCCAKAECFELGAMCHGQAVKNGVEFVLPVSNSLIYMYACFEMAEVARKLFDEMSDKDVVSWNSMMEGYVRLGDIDGARKLFDEMLERNEVSWNVMIGGYMKAGNPGKGLKLFRDMMGREVKWSDTTMVLAVTACARSARLKEGKSVHARSVKNSHNWSLLVDTTLIDMYSKCGRSDTAQLVFRRMFKKNLVTWNAMIVGHCIHGNPTHGLSLFNEMVNCIASGADKENFSGNKKHVLKPDETTYIAILCACARIGLLEEGKRHFADMIRVWNITPNFAHYWCMANIYVNAGLVLEAGNALKNMPEISQDVSPQSLKWASILAACRFQENISEAERVGYSLINVEPENSLCYALLLNIYAVAGRWEDVAKIRDFIKERGIGIRHGCSLFDLKTVVHDFEVADKVLSSVEFLNNKGEQYEVNAME